MPLNLSLDPYEGPFGVAQASHLVRRTTFVHNLELRNEALSLGLTAAVERLLEVQPLPSRPLNYGVVDLLVPIGQTWVGALFTQGTVQYRRRSMNAWDGRTNG